MLIRTEQHALNTSCSGGDDDLIHAFAFDGAKSAIIDYARNDLVTTLGKITSSLPLPVVYG